MANTDKTGYLYAIKIDDDRYYGRGPMTSSLICPEVLWESKEEAYRSARRSGRLQDNSTYRFYEFAYVMTLLDEDVTVQKWSGKVKVHEDKHGQYIVKSGHIYRPQISQKCRQKNVGAFLARVSAKGYTGEAPLSDIRVKVRGGKPGYASSYSFTAYVNYRPEYYGRTNQFISASSVPEAEVAVDKWIDGPHSNPFPVNSSLTIKVIFEKGGEQQWFNHGPFKKPDLESLRSALRESRQVFHYSEPGCTKKSAHVVARVYKSDVKHKKRDTEKCWLP